MTDVDRTESFQSQRPLMFSIAYRMLGSAAEADDVLQDAWLRWESADGVEIRSDKAWLSTVVTRLCLDRLKSARATREDYVGPWLPEPIETKPDVVDPESISIAFLVLLERLTPVERAAYLLHEAFDYSHAEVARMLDKEEDACRQLFHRAQARIREGRPRFAPSRAAHERLVRSFATALGQGDVHLIEETLAEDATLWADSGGKVPAAARRPVSGAHAVALFFASLARRIPDDGGWTTDVRDINGWPALIGFHQGRVAFAMSIETDGQRIVAIRNVVNPDKLRGISSVA
jgi:RNA polymerase sigma-70 factor (ECF subfamily)